ncbi:MAG: hypothetical protein DRG11_03225 [Epsilonproteobacteria bacterium]|nr:MAG: hypothetical protein DRG11_03225 [Campylobacterota bacterium]
MKQLAYDQSSGIDTDFISQVKEHERDKTRAKHCEHSLGSTDGCIRQAIARVRQQRDKKMKQLAYDQSSGIDTDFISQVKEHERDKN